MVATSAVGRVVWHELSVPAAVTASSEGAVPQVQFDAIASATTGTAHAEAVVTSWRVMPRFFVADSPGPSADVVDSSSGSSGLMAANTFVGGEVIKAYTSSRIQGIGRTRPTACPSASAPLASAPHAGACTA
ncbi:MAG: hypothetical protein JWQ19_1044 [Subtercola sp.]|nr:hypothetical protein [Subtercola sp.]